MRKVILLSIMLIVTAALLSASVSVTPASGNLPVGGSVTVTNNGDSPVHVFVDGTYIGSVPAGESVSYPVPNDPNLIGVEITVEVKDNSGTVLATRDYTITLPATAEETESEEASQQEL